MSMTLPQAKCTVCSGYDMIVLLAPMPDKQLPPLHIACLAPGRQLPHIKHSQWVKDRQVSVHSAPPCNSSYTTHSHPGRLPGNDQALGALLASLKLQPCLTFHGISAIPAPEQDLRHPGQQAGSSQALCILLASLDSQQPVNSPSLLASHVCCTPLAHTAAAVSLLTLCMTSCRSQYLPLLPPGASDGVCCSPDGRLLETFISNLFIIQQQPDGQPVVRTAGEGILPGIMRSQVLQVCAELQLPCQLQAPLCTERSQWREAFVTNAVRGIRPVDNIHCMHNKDLSLTPWQLRMPDGAPGAITLLVMNRLEERRLAKVETMTLLWRKLRAQGKVD